MVIRFESGAPHLYYFLSITIKTSTVEVCSLINYPQSHALHGADEIETSTVEVSVKYYHQKRWR